jgi:FkbM family methyltransferase
MLDVGANAGFYSLLAAKYGHNAIQFDLQPECHIILRNSVLANGFHLQIVTVAAGVTESDSIMDVPDIGCDGRFPQAEPSKDAPIHKIHLHPLNEFIDTDKAEIMLMKVDTEGNEKQVLSGAIDFFQKKKIQNAIVEVTPCCDFWKKAGIIATDVYEIFGDIVSFGYVMVSLYDLKLLQTKEEVIRYLSQEATFRQTDMWLTLDNSDVAKVIQSIQGLQQQQ